MPDREHQVAMLDELPRGGLRQVEMDGQKVLLARDGDTVRAVGATCPHAGGPLAQGVRHGDRVVCPWHKATFCLRTGRLLEPPAVDPLPRHAVRIEQGRVWVELSDPAPVPRPAADARCFVIVGAGAAGAMAAQTLREQGFGGRIVMLDRENRVPYDRTVLSKYHLSGEHGGEKSPLQTQAFYQQQRIERRTAEVTRIDPPARRVLCADGATFTYDALLLATGGVPRRPSIAGANLGNVFVLRSRADADAILAQAERSTRAVILGAGFIGMEAAASLRERGLEVTVVTNEPLPLQRQLGAEVAQAWLSLQTRHGVAFRLGRRIVAFSGGAEVQAARLDDGEELPADLVVIGFGIAPATAYADGLPVNDDGGISVDPELRAADGIYAAGDIARFPLRGDGDPVRVEHWRVAEQQGRVAAMNMLGQHIRYDAVPVFWTIQYLQRLDYIGHATEWEEVVVHGDLHAPRFLAYYVQHGRVLAAAGLDCDRETAALLELFTARRDWTAAELGATPSARLARGR